MKVTSRLFRFGFILLIALTLLSPATAYGHSPNVDSINHSDHVQNPSAAVANPQINCASACAQNLRAEQLPTTLKASEQKEDRQSQPEPVEEKEQSKPLVEPAVPKPSLLPAREIYKFTCAYLF